MKGLIEIFSTTPPIQTLYNLIIPIPLLLVASARSAPPRCKIRNSPLALSGALREIFFLQHHQHAKSKPAGQRREPPFHHADCRGGAQGKQHRLGKTAG